MPLPSGRRRVVLRIVAALALVALVALAVTTVVLQRRLSDWARTRTIAELSDRFDGDVELTTLDVQLGSRIGVTGGPLVLRHKGRRDVPPLIAVERFEVRAAWRQLFWQHPRRISAITLHGLKVTLPPPPGRDQPRDLPGRSEDDPRREHPPVSTFAPPAAHARPPAPPRPSPVVIDHLSADGTVLTILPLDAHKVPRAFTLQTMHMHDVALDRPMAFTAILDNPIPRGRIQTTGTFGPWVGPDPRQTALEARYTFRNADMNTIKGIAGILQSEGRYSGVLERIVAQGTTTTPDFRLDIADHPSVLTTTFEAVVDGTNGNTWLTDVEAMLGQATPISAKGGVVKAEDRRGRTVDLAVQIDSGRIEEVLALAVSTPTPLMTGLIDVTATLLIPPGRDRSVAERMELEGRFALREASFTSDLVQGKLDELSRRSRGRPQARQIANVASGFRGRFRMDDGVLRFRSLSFRVEGARVDLTGHYTLAGQGIHFDGRIRMDAGVSQMVSGRKAWLLKMVDPLFRRDGATEFPIRIRGTAKTPQFGVDVKATLKRALLPGR